MQIDLIPWLRLYVQCVTLSVIRSGKQTNVSYMQLCDVSKLSSKYLKLYKPLKCMKDWSGWTVC